MTIVKPNGTHAGLQDGALELMSKHPLIDSHVDLPQVMRALSTPCVETLRLLLTHTEDRKPNGHERRRPAYASGEAGRDLHGSVDPCQTGSRFLIT